MTASLNNKFKSTGAKIASAIPDERLYFAGLKKPPVVSDMTPNIGFKDDVLNFITDNPIVTIGSAVVAGMGLYYGTKSKPVVIPPVSMTAHYTDALQSVMGGFASLIAGRGVIKYMAQESAEVASLRYDIQILEKNKRFEAKQKKSFDACHCSKPVIKIQKKPENYDIDMSHLFNN